ncbi:MAG: HupE/UreJ family protein [Novosphingobium sp.]
MTLAATVAALLPATAQAHAGHEGAGGIAAGLLHPLSGADHLVAMVLVGVCAGLFAPDRRSALALPGLFLAAMLAGFLGGGALGAAAEPLILVSLCALSAAVALRLRTPAPLAASAVIVFGFAHGAAHGLEVPATAEPMLFAAGFLLATAGLHGIGLALARVLPARLIPAAGAAGAGLALLLAG